MRVAQPAGHAGGHRRDRAVFGRCDPFADAQAGTAGDRQRGCDRAGHRPANRCDSHRSGGRGDAPEERQADRPVCQ